MLVVTIDERNRAMLPLPMPQSEAERTLTLDEKVDLRLAQSKTLEDLGRVLYQLLSGQYSVWTDGSLLEIRGLVASVGALKIVIRPNEHPPPHFHVIAGDLDASFAIADCALLRGEIPSHQRRLIVRWHAGAKPLLIRVWNETRPSNCPVGPILGD